MMNFLDFFKKRPERIPEQNKKKTVTINPATDVYYKDDSPSNNNSRTGINPKEILNDQPGKKFKQSETMTETQTKVKYRNPNYDSSSMSGWFESQGPNKVEVYATSDRNKSSENPLQQTQEFMEQSTAERRKTSYYGRLNKALMDYQLIKSDYEKLIAQDTKGLKKDTHEFNDPKVESKYKDIDARARKALDEITSIEELLLQEDKNYEPVSTTDKNGAISLDEKVMEDKLKISNKDSHGNTI